MVKNKLGIAIAEAHIGDPVTGDLEVAEANGHLLGADGLNVIVHFKISRAGEADDGEKTDGEPEPGDESFEHICLLYRI